MKTTYVMRAGKLVEKDKAAPVHSHNYSRTDSTDVVSPVTGEHFTSKARYYGHLKEHQCHIKEAGDVGKRPKPTGVRESVRLSLRQLGL